MAMWLHSDRPLGGHSVTTANDNAYSEVPEAAIAARLILRVAAARVLPCSPWQPGGPVWYLGWSFFKFLGHFVFASLAAYSP